MSLKVTWNNHEGQAQCKRNVSRALNYLTNIGAQALRMR